MCQVDEVECHSGTATQVVAEIPGSVTALPFSFNASEEVNTEVAKFQDSEQHAWKEGFKRNPLAPFVYMCTTREGIHSQICCFQN